MKRAFFTALVLLFVTIVSNAQNCLPEGIEFATQQQIDNFSINYPGCSVIAGDVTISGNEIGNLSGLLALTKIEGNLLIENNPSLTGLNGLDNLERINGNFTFRLNDLITNMGGLGSLKAVGGNLLIQYTKLENLLGLSNLEFVGGFWFEISVNDNLLNLNGLEGIEVLSADVNIENNPVLNDLSGFSNLTQISASLSITLCPSLVDLSGLNSLKSVERFHIENNDGLTDLTGLGQLESVILNFWLIGNDQLESLDGLGSLQTLGSLWISGNAVLQDLSAIPYMESLSTVSITNNPELAFCAVPSICAYLYNDIHDVVFYGNAAGCNSIEEVIISCGGIIVVSEVMADLNGDCVPDASTLPVVGAQVKLEGVNYRSTRSADENGLVNNRYFDTEAFVITLPQFPTANWAVCQDTFFVPANPSGDSVVTPFLLSAINSCPQLTTELILPPFFRGCLAVTQISVVIRNTGSETAENTSIGVVLSDELELLISNPPVSAVSGDTLFFETGNLLPFQSETILLNVKTKCDAAFPGNTICVEAFGYLDNPCPPLPEVSDVRVYSECLSDTTIRFTLKNILGGSTQNPHEYIIIEDEIVLMTNPFNLGPFGTMTVDVPANAATYRMEATRLEDGTLTATAREGCGGFTPGLITAFWLNTHLSDYDYDCREVVAAYDPNQKTAIPKGIGEQHLLPKNTPITYTIEFQNTGTDTAFRVLLRDVLSENLDVTTFRPLGATHPYTWEIRGGDTLEVLFQPIALPDSNVNEVASHGWFSFHIHQKKDLPDGTLIKNAASIIFDYNPPIITNTTFHTIGELTVGATYIPNHQQNSLWQVSSNPVNQKAVFSSNVALPGTQHFSLINASGTTVKDQFFTDRRFEFERGHLPAGL